MTKIKKVKKSERRKLEKLLQLYLHDISLYFPIDFNSKKGEYEYDSLDLYFDNNNNYPYFIIDNDNIEGFILVDISEGENVIQEIFVMNNYKNKGIGEEAVNLVFNKHKGNWIVKSLPCSKKAEKFWNRVIKKYTMNKYEVEHIGKYNRAVFKFSNVKTNE